MRFFIQFSYFGKAYHGWQSQPNAITVQEVLEGCLSTIFQNKIILVGAGRTDSGVHAEQMYAHFDLDILPNFNDLMYKVNSILPKDIAVHAIFEVPKTAHARFHAISRTYRYQITKAKNPFLQDLSYLVLKEVDVSLMNQAAELLIGTKDFECFSKLHTDNHTNMCNVSFAHWHQEGQNITFTITANRFLRNMVRAVVGTLINVGIGKYPVAYVNTILKSKDRAMAGTSVPAKGLYLTAIEYPKDILKNG